MTTPVQPPKATTPTTRTYIDLRLDELKKIENIKYSIYIDSYGLLTIGIGQLLVDKNGKLQNQTFTDVRAQVDAANQTLFDDIQKTLGVAKNNKIDLAKDFLIDDKGNLIRYRNGSSETDPKKWTDISKLLPDEAAAERAIQRITNYKEGYVNDFINAYNRDNSTNLNLSETQRVALFSRYYNGLNSDASEKLRKAIANGDNESILQAFSFERASPGHLPRTINEFVMFMDGKAKAVTVDGKPAFEVTDAKGDTIVVGYTTQVIKGRVSPDALFSFRKIPANGVSPEGREYFNPNYVAGKKQMKYLTSAPIPLNGLDRNTRLEEVDRLVDEAVNKMGLTGDEAQAAKEKLRIQFRELTAGLEDADLTIAATQNGLTVSGNDLAIDIASNGDAQSIKVENGLLVQTKVNDSPFGLVAVSSISTDGENWQANRIEVAGVDVTDSSKYGFNAQGDVLAIESSNGGTRADFTVLAGSNRGDRASVEFDLGQSSAGWKRTLAGWGVGFLPSDGNELAYTVTTVSAATGKQTVTEVTPIRFDGETLGQKVVTSEFDGGLLSSKTVETNVINADGSRTIEKDAWTFQNGEPQSRVTETKITSGGWSLSQQTITYEANGTTVASIATIEQLPNGIVRQTVLDGKTNLLATKETQTSDDGSFTETITKGESIVTRVVDLEGNLFSRSESTMRPDGTLVTQRYDGAGKLVGSAARKTYDDGSYEELVTDKDGKQIKNTFNSDGSLFKTETVKTALDAWTRENGPTVDAISDFFGLYQALKNGKPLPIVVAGVNTLSSLQALNKQNVANTSLSSVQNVLNGVSSLYNLNRALKEGDAADIAITGASAFVVIYSALSARPQRLSQSANDSVWILTA